MKNNPLVSIACSAYNQAEYLPLMIKSLCNQSYDNIELIVVDDGSSDNTWEVLNHYYTTRKNLPIELDIILQDNRGLYYTLQRILDKMVTGDLLGFCMTDTIWRDDTIKNLVDGINEGYDYAWCNTAEIGRDGIMTRYWDFSKREDAIWSVASLFSREWYEKIGGYESSFKYVHDADLYFRLLASGARSRYVNYLGTVHWQHDQKRKIDNHSAGEEYINNEELKLIILVKNVWMANGCPISPIPCKSFTEIETWVKKINQKKT